MEKFKIKDGELIIPEDITYLKKGTFLGYSNLRKIRIPQKIDQIHHKNFQGFTGVTSIIVEEGNAVYDSRENCNAIIETKTNTLLCGCSTTVIPQSVTSIAPSAFKGCTDLTSIVIPEEVKEIGEAAFEGCTGLKNITIAEGNTIFDSRENCNAIIETQTNTLLYGCSTTVIPQSVTCIASSAFKGCTDLTEIVIPEGVKEIEKSAFEGCTGLSEISVPNNIIIHESAFNGCRRYDIVLPKEVQIKSDSDILLQKILNNTWGSANGFNGFGNNKLESSQDFGIASGFNGFGNNKLETSQDFGSASGFNGFGNNKLESSQDFGSASGFNGFGDNKLETSNSQEWGGGNGFNEVGNNLSGWGMNDFNNANDNILKNENEFSSTDLNEFEVRNGFGIIPEGISIIPENAFKNCTNLSVIVIPQGIEEIGASAFEGCTNLTRINIPRNVTYLGKGAFKGCTSLNQVSMPFKKICETSPFEDCPALKFINYFSAD